MRSLTLFALFALCLLSVCLAAPSRPRLAETFESTGYVSTKYNQTLYFGEGWYHVSQPDGKALEAYAFGGFDHLNVYELQRYDKGRAYEVIHIAHDKQPICHTKPLTGQMPALWDWLNKATFVRNFTSAGTLYDLWQYKTAGVTLEVGVPNAYPDVLAYFGRSGSNFETAYYVEKWRNDKPHSSWFDIPRECHFGPK